MFRCEERKLFIANEEWGASREDERSVEKKQRRITIAIFQNLRESEKQQQQQQQQPQPHPPPPPPPHATAVAKGRRKRDGGCNKAAAAEGSGVA